MEVLYGRPNWARFFPRDAAASITITIGLSALVGVATVGLAVYVLRDYGWALFLGTPLAMGFLAPLLHGMGAKRTYWESLLASTLAQMALFGGMLVFGIEGIICVMMAAPLWMAVAVVGTSIAHPIHLAMWHGHVTGRGFPVMGLVLVLLAPGWMGAEHAAHEESPVFAVISDVEIAAPPEIVWQRVIAFPELPEPTEWMFRLGVAYPQRAVILGHGAGAVRRCEFSTGAFVEPIRVWDENHRLAFDVTENPPTMKELSPYPNLHPAHLEGYLESRRGEFRLIDLGNGHTRLVGTTWYQNRMFPVAYWQLWSDSIIHSIHLRVLTHIKGLAEGDVRAGFETVR